MALLAVNMVTAAVFDNHVLASRTASGVELGHFAEEFHFTFVLDGGVRSAVLLACLVFVPGNLAVGAEADVAVWAFDVREAGGVKRLEYPIAAAAT
jgi:hypothetical protein